MAKYFKKYNSNYEVEIFVEDNIVGNYAEVIFPYVYTSAKSIELKEELIKRLDNPEIKIYYSDISKSKI